MRRKKEIAPDLAELIDRACARSATAEERERQLVSLAYGNLKIEDDRVTKTLVEQSVRKLLARRS